MYKFEIVVKRDDEKLFSFGITQTEIDVANKHGISRHEYIEQLAKIKAEEWRNANLSDSE
jgi:hypothetical protein